MKTIESKEYKILYKNIDTPWLTMVHGFSQDNRYFQKLAKYYSKNFNILLPNLLGHGERYDDIGPFGFMEYSKDILNILKKLKIDKTLYLGTHTGSAVGVILACTHPQLISGLILEGLPVPGIDIPSVKTYFDRAKINYLKKGRVHALKDWLKNAKWFSYMNNNKQETNYLLHQEMVLDFHGKHFIENRSPEKVINALNLFKKYKGPALCYNGEFDLEDFKSAVKCFNVEYPQISHSEIKKSGGFPAWENMDEVIKHIDNFLNSNNFTHEH